MRYVEFNPGIPAMAAGHEDEDIDVSGWSAHYSPEKWEEVLGLGVRESGDLDRLR